MTKRSATHAPDQPLWLSDADIQLLRTIATCRMMNATDATYYHYAPASHTYVRSRLARLAGGADHCNHYLYRFDRPHTDPGRAEKVFTVGTKGWDLLAQLQGGGTVTGRSLPYRAQARSYAFVQHALLLTRFVTAAAFWSRKQQQQQAYTLEFCLSYELARQPSLTAMTQQGKTVSVIPDAFVCFERVADGKRFPLLFEADCGTISGRKLRQHIRNRLVYLQSPQYQALAKTTAGRVLYLTTGYLPRYKESRRALLQRITQDVLTELHMHHWAPVFLFAAVEYTHLFQTPLFDQPLWYPPHSQTPVSLLSR